MCAIPDGWLRRPPVKGEFNLRIQRYVSLVAASLMAIVPANSLAQTVPYYQDYDQDVSVRNRPRPEYDPMGMRLGGFDLNAQLDLSVTSTDNLFADVDALAEDDIYFDVSPYARLASHWSRHAVGVEAGANFRMHEEFSSEDAETYFTRGFGRLDIGSNSSLTGNLGFAHVVEPRTDPDSPLPPFEPVEYDRTDASLTAQHRFNRFRLAGTVARSEYEFDDAFQAAFRDNEVTLFRGRVEAEVTPRIGVLLQAETDERDYADPTLSSEGQTYLVGAVVHFTDLMRGEVAVGQFERDYDSGATVDGTAVSANLEWYITRLTTLSFNARRNSEEVIGGTTLAPYVATSYGARVDHELLRNVILTAGVQAGTREYETIDRDDDFVYADAGVDYLVNRRVVVRGRYRYDQVESDGAMPYRDYEVNALTLGVSLRL